MTVGLSRSIVASYTTREGSRFGDVPGVVEGFPRYFPAILYEKSHKQDL